MKLALLAAASLSNVTPQPDPLDQTRRERAAPKYRIEANASDRDAAASLEPVLAFGIRKVERFFRKPFQRSFVVMIYSDRSSFDARLRRDFGVPDPQRWMVAAGISSQLVILSPKKWRAESQEHDGRDSRHVREIVAHELVHVFHAQVNPGRDFDGMDELGWLVEGLAVYVSGQLEHSHRDAAERAVAEGKAPTALVDAWSGKYRYGVCGSMVRFVDEQFGRKTIDKLLQSTSNPEALTILGMSERAFLDAWSGWLLSSGNADRRGNESLDYWN